MSLYMKGVLLTALGVVILSPDALLIRMGGADVATTMAVRGGLACLMLIVLAAVRGTAVRIGRWEALLGALYGLSGVLFVIAVFHANVASVLVTIAATPLVAALIGVVLLKERAPPRTWLAALAIVAGNVVIFSGDLGDGVWGMVAALTICLAMALFFCIVRKMPHTDRWGALIFGSGLATLIAMPFADPDTLTLAGLPWLAVLGAVVIPVSFLLISRGPKYIPAPEVSLLMLLETVLGPLWVWIVLAEAPDERAVWAGALILGALFAHGLAGARDTRTRRARDRPENV